MYTFLNFKFEYDNDILIDVHILKDHYSLFDSVYGMTETGPITMLNWDEDSTAGSVGSLISNTECKVRADVVSFSR